MKTKLTRREFLKQSLAGAGLTIAVSVTPFGHRLFALTEKDRPLAFAPNAWLQITPDNKVVIIVNKSEMGQGVYTSLPMIVADEVDADWGLVKMEVAPAAEQYKDPLWGMQATGGSTSVRHMYEPLRAAAASARVMLVKAAADTWGVGEDDCETSKSVVKNKRDGKTLTYGKLTAKAAHLPLPKNPKLKKAAQFSLIGTPVERLDIAEKVNGKAIFGIDVQVKDMLYGTLERPPVYGANVVSYDAESARKVPGVRNITLISRGIAVCADTIGAAWDGKKALKATWSEGVQPSMNNESLEKNFFEHLEKEGLIAINRGDAKVALKKSVKKIEAVYLLPYLSHMNMEPMNCTASVTKESCDVWAPTQNQTGILELAKKLTGLKPEQIRVHTTFLGTGFGRRFETDFVEEAIEASKAAGRPVKVLWRREEDIGHDFFRPGNLTRIEGGLGEKGNLTAWSHRIVVPSIFSRAMPGRIKNGIDPAAVDGIEETPYEFPNFRVEFVKIDTPVAVGFWRSVGNSHNAFTMESFMEEMAGAAGKDPVEFRLALLKDNPRARRLIETVAEKSGWGKPPRRGQALGFAHHFSFGTYVAQAAEVSLDRESGRIKVHRVVCAVDCGRAVNPNTIKAQMEGGIIMGLSAGLMEKIEFASGGVKSSNYDNYPVLRMNDTPEIEVHIVLNDETVGGVGEPGVPPIAPAVANAVFRAAKIRLRRLPMNPETVKAALKTA